MDTNNNNNNEIIIIVIIMNFMKIIIIIIRKTIMKKWKITRIMVVMTPTPYMNLCTTVCLNMLVLFASISWHIDMKLLTPSSRGQRQVSRRGTDKQLQPRVA